MDSTQSQAAKTRGATPEDPTPEEKAETIGTDYALVLAGNVYDHWPGLENPIYDTETLRSELVTNFGYKSENIFYAENPTKLKVQQLLDQLQHHTFDKKNDRLFVYIAGHGYVKGNAGYMVTKDTQLPEVDPYLSSALNLSELRDTIDGLPVPHILVVLDVCYGGSFRDRKMLPPYTSENVDSPQPVDVEVSNKMQAASRIYIASGGMRQAFDGEPGRHSPFARTFLKTLRQYGGSEHLIDAGKLEGRGVWPLSASVFWNLRDPARRWRFRIYPKTERTACSRSGPGHCWSQRAPMLRPDCES